VAWGSYWGKIVSSKTITQEAHAMIRISHAKLFEHEIVSTVNAFFHTFGVASFLKKVGAFKKKGVPAVSIVQYRNGKYGDLLDSAL
jgi:hypothetical protein